MEGLKLTPGPGEFSKCFRKIFDRMTPLHWLGEHASFRFAEITGDDDWDGEAGRYVDGPMAALQEKMEEIPCPAHVGNPAILFKPGFLPKHADLVAHSTTLIGFRQRPSAWILEMLRKGNAGFDPGWARRVSQECELYISTIDDAIWVLFARDGDVITRIRQGHDFPAIPSLERFLRRGSV